VKRTALRPFSAKRLAALGGYVCSTLQRFTPLRKRNEKRRQKLYAKQYGDEADVVRALPCYVCRHAGIQQTKRTVAAHAWHTKGAGGKKDDLLNLCETHEVLLHNIGRLSFERLYDLNLEQAVAECAAKVAAELEAEWQEMRGES